MKKRFLLEINTSRGLESMLYPNPLLTAKTLPIPEMRRDVKDPKLISYTKHYYIGSERISSVIGSKRGLGAYPGLSETTIPLNLVEDIVDAAGTAVQGAVAHFGKTIVLPQPFRFSSGLYNGSDLQDPENYAAFWYHPDHLGSSSYITNLQGEITQHMEYLPFGETLIEEHLNSNNSPYKFNAKEMDAETGNYYYGARYYSPKYNLMLSVDPLYEMFPGVSPYAYVLNNPLRYTDPTGMAAENADDCGFGCGLRKVFNTIFHPNRSQLPDGRIERTGTKSGTSRATGWKHPGSSKSTTEDKNTSESRTPQETLASNLSKIGVNSLTFIPNIDTQIHTPKFVSSDFEFEDDSRRVAFDLPPPDFGFSTIGGVARNWNGRLSGGTNYIIPLSNSQQQNLKAIANYLIANPQATIRFQYPAPGADFHPTAANDLRKVYQMNFSQMTNYLIQQGISEPNRRVLMNYGTGFKFIVDPGN